jgi:hypothetical protein
MIAALAILLALALAGILVCLAMSASEDQRWGDK